MNSLKDRPFALIGINLMRHDAGKLREVMDREKLNWRSFDDDGAIARAWNVSGTPAYYLIDHHGVIRFRWSASPGEKVIDAAVEKLVEEAEGKRASD